VPDGPRVSVIVPAYNSSETIEATLSSVVAQTYDDWEVVVGDDGSSDDTAARAAAVDPRVRVVRAERNGGPAAARNLALEHARGELVALLDADDRWLPEYLETMVGAYDREDRGTGTVGIVTCDAFVEGPTGREPQTYKERIGAPDRVDLDTLLQANVIFISALMPRARVMEVGGFDIRTFGSEDHDLFLKLVESGLRVVVVAEPLAVYRVAEASVSSSAVGMARTTQTTYRLALARGRLHGRRRRIAQRQLAIHRAIEQLETRGARSPRALAGAALAFGAEALARPRMWPVWARNVAAGRLRPWRSR
jgi:glycosyltransferase involved in cell wall biosynthesis